MTLTERGGGGGIVLQIRLERSAGDGLQDGKVLQQIYAKEQTESKPLYNSMVMLLRSSSSAIINNT